MKNILLLLSIIFTFSMTSCGSDDSTTTPDEEELKLTNEFNFNGIVLVGENGLIKDVGVESKAPDHYTYIIGISDGAIQISSTTGNHQYLTSSSFSLTFGASAFSTSGFKTGTYTYRAAASSLPDDNFVFDGTFKDYDNSQTLSMTGGKVTISGTSPSYSISTDLTFTGGRKLTGAFIGTFEIK
jgi:hypothetical protein